MEIDNLLSPSKDSFTTLLEDTALPVSLIRSSSGKSLGEHKVKGASAPLEKEDISVSYETRPNGGFSVFYTVPKEPVEASKMDKLKRLIEQANEQENYSDYEGDYYEEGEYEGNDIDSYEVEEYYDDEEELLTEPPDIADDYYDPGPPDSYYDDAAEDNFDEYDDYEDDYYYDAAEDRMLVESSTPAPVAVLSPTVQKLNEISQMKEMLLRRMKGIKNRAKKNKKKKPRKNKKVDMQGKKTRPKRWAPVDNVDTSAVSVTVLDNNGLDLSRVDSVDLQSDGSHLDPSLYEINTYEPYENSYDPYSPPYHQSPEFIPYPGDELEDLDEFFDIYGEKKKKPPVVARTWLENVLKFRNALFGDPDKKHHYYEDEGKPQLKIHYPESDGPAVVTITKAKRRPLDVKPSIFTSPGVQTDQLPPVVSIQQPNTAISNPATSISQPATTISQPALDIQVPGLSIRQPAVDLVSTPGLTITNQPPQLLPLVPSGGDVSNINTFAALGRLRASTMGGPNSATTTRLVTKETIDEFLSEQEYDYEEEYYHDEDYYDDYEHYDHQESHHPYHKKKKYHKKKHHSKGKHHPKKKHHYKKKHHVKPTYHGEEGYGVEEYHSPEYPQHPEHQVQEYLGEYKPTVPSHHEKGYHHTKDHYGEYQPHIIKHHQYHEPMKEYFKEPYSDQPSYYHGTEVFDPYKDDFSPQKESDRYFSGDYIPPQFQPTEKARYHDYKSVYQAGPSPQPKFLPPSHTKSFQQSKFQSQYPQPKFPPPSHSFSPHQQPFHSEPPTPQKGPQLLPKKHYKFPIKPKQEEIHHSTSVVYAQEPEYHHSTSSKYSKPAPPPYSPPPAKPAHVTSPPYKFDPRPLEWRLAAAAAAAKNLGGAPKKLQYSKEVGIPPPTVIDTLFRKGPSEKEAPHPSYTYLPPITEKPPLVPHNYLEHRIVVNLEPQGGSYTLGKRQGQPALSLKSPRFLPAQKIEAHQQGGEDMLIDTSSQTSSVNSQRDGFFPFQQQLPPTLYDNPPPTLYDKIYPKAQPRGDQYAPPSLNSYLPPTLFDKKKYDVREFLKKAQSPPTSPRPPLLMKRPPPLPPPTPRPTLPPSRPSTPPPRHPPNFPYQLQAGSPRPNSDGFGSSPLGLPTYGVGSKNGPTAKVYKSQISFKPSPPTAIKNEVKTTKSYVSNLFQASSMGHQETTPTVSKGKSKIPSATKYRYQSQIRYVKNSPIVASKPMSESPPSRGQSKTPLKKTLFRQDFLPSSEHQIPKNLSSFLPTEEFKNLSEYHRSPSYRHPFLPKSYEKNVNGPLFRDDFLPKKEFQGKKQSPSHLPPFLPPSQANFHRSPSYKQPFLPTSEYQEPKEKSTFKRNTGPPPTVPCQGPSRFFMKSCVLVKKPMNPVVSSLPQYSTQIPRPPFSQPNPTPLFQSPMAPVRSLPAQPQSRYNPRPYPSHETNPTSSHLQPYSSHPSHQPNLQFAKRKARSEPDVP